LGLAMKQDLFRPASATATTVREILYALNL